MVQIADREILADVQIEIAAPGSQDKGAGDRRSPDYLAIDDASEVLQYRITVVSGFRDRGIRVGAQQDGIWSVDSNQTKHTDGVGDGIGVIADVGRKRLDCVAGALADALNTAGRIAREDRAILGEC